MCRPAVRRSSPLLPAAVLAWMGLAAAPLHAEDTHKDTYQVVKVAPKASVGVKAVASVTIEGRNGWHVNDQAPVTLKLTPVPGVTLDKEKLTKADLKERTADRARFDVGFKASEPGAKSINAEASFVMCQDTACRPIKEKLELAFDVGPAVKAKTKPARAKPARKKARA